MRFLNTGIEFNILKTFPNLEKAEEYYSKVFGVKVDLDEEGYSNNLERTILFSRKPVEFIKLSGIINEIRIETETISNVLKDIKDIDSELRNNHTTFFKKIQLDINYIDYKKLTFEQIKKRLIARYGKPTSNNGTVSIRNWKTGYNNSYKKGEWSDKEVSLRLTGLNHYIQIIILNNSSILKSFYEQAIKIAKAQEQIIEKKAIMDINF